MWRWNITREKRGWHGVDVYLTPVLTLFWDDDFRELRIEWLIYAVGISCGCEY